jgi:hypothetical protein
MTIPTANKSRTKPKRRFYTTDDGRQVEYCKPGWHNPEAPHSESDCFTIHPEKRHSRNPKAVPVKDVHVSTFSTSIINIII